jgi:hypothetical protein
MLTVSDAVENHIANDAFAQEALQRGVLNITAYAREILPAIENATEKSVHLPTLVVALSRLTTTVQPMAIQARVKIDNLSITSSLSEVVFERTDALLQALADFKIPTPTTFFTVTEGLHEVAIICSTEIVNDLADLNSKIKAQHNQLVAVSVRFGNHYLEVPNALYSLMGALAVRRINIRELISTYTELTFIVDSQDMDESISALYFYSRNSAADS